MGKANSKPKDVTPNKNYELYGFNEQGADVNIPLSSILDLLTDISQGGSLVTDVNTLTFSLDGQIHETQGGFITTNNSEIDPVNISTLRIGKIDLLNNNLVPFLTSFISNDSKDSVVLNIVNKDDPRDYVIFTVTGGDVENDYVDVRVAIIPSLYNGQLKNNVDYEVRYDVISNQDLSKFMNIGDFISDALIGDNPFPISLNDPDDGFTTLIKGGTVYIGGSRFDIGDSVKTHSSNVNVQVSISSRGEIVYSERGIGAPPLPPSSNIILYTLQTNDLGIGLPQDVRDLSYMVDFSKASVKVADGINDGDAVNKGQLNEVSDKVGINTDNIENNTSSLSELADSAVFSSQYFDTLSDAILLTPKPSNGTVFRVSEVTDPVNAGVYSFNDGEVNGVRFEKSTVDKILISDLQRPWFKPVVEDYNEDEYIAIKSILYFYARDTGFRMYQISNGESSVDKSIGIQDQNTGEVHVIYRGTEDTGSKIYQCIFNNTPIIVHIDWDKLPEKDTFYLNTVSQTRILPTDVLIDDYKNLFVIKNPVQNFEYKHRVVISNDEIRYRSSLNSTVQLSSNNDINVSREKVSCSFYLDDARENSCSIGYVNSTTGDRFLFGYEASEDGIIVFSESTGFKKVVESGNLKTGYLDISVGVVNGEIIGYLNNESFVFSEIGVTNDMNALDVRRMHLKIRNSDFHIKNYNVYLTKEYSSIFDNTGEDVYIYQTGLRNFRIGYNDWCFVRTPKGYDPNRDRPYPFVIGNHGNGWTMFGGENTANFMQTTQFGVDTQNNGAYLDTSNPYYKEFSSETIERLLEAGYIVCGTMNYQAAEYGSDRGRNALQEFFYHMRRRWNVEEKCYMIGVSNGGMMSLNGAFLLGVENIKAIVLIYPLCMLFRHYKGYVPHRPSIDLLYGLSGTESDEELKLIFNNHDPENANSVVIGGLSYKTSDYPPIKIWHSLDDTVTASVNNATPFIEMIKRSNGKIEEVIASGNHGDHTMVDAIGILDFFNTYL